MLHKFYPNLKNMETHKHIHSKYVYCVPFVCQVLYEALEIQGCFLP